MTLADDPLLAWRAAFPALESCVHLVSHSLGCVPAKAEEDLAEFYDLWQTKSITAWDAWVPEVAHAAARIERLISAPAGTVAIQPNVSAAMACVASCFEFAAPRNRVVYESLMFPSVSYVWKAEERRGAEVVVVESADGATIDADAVCAAIDERTLLVPIQHVVFSSAFIQDVKKIARRAAAVGAHVILDCYQSIGAVPIDVVDLGVAFACGGSIKYLCGGPGAGWLYVRQDLVDRFEPRATGWFANAHPFAFTMPAQTYAEGVWRYLTGTPAIAALYQSRAGQTIVAEIGVSRDPREVAGADRPRDRARRRRRLQAHQPARGRGAAAARWCSTSSALPTSRASSTAAASSATTARRRASASRRTSIRRPRRSTCSSPS
jgi:kynureninase